MKLILNIIFFIIAINNASLLFAQTTTIHVQPVPKQKDFQEQPDNKKHPLFHGQKKLCGLFCLYNGYRMLKDLENITSQEPSKINQLSKKLSDVYTNCIIKMCSISDALFQDSWILDCVSEDFGNGLSQKYLQHLDAEYFSHFEKFFTDQQSLVELEKIKQDNKDGIGNLTGKHLNRVTDAHPELAAIKKQIIYSDLDSLAEAIIKPQLHQRLVSAAKTFFQNPDTPLLLLIIINKHWVTMLFTKETTFVADSCNRYVKAIDEDITLIDKFFRTTISA